MTGSPSSVIMVGFGNGTFSGSPSLVVTLGFGTEVSSQLVSSLAGAVGLRPYLDGAGGIKPYTEGLGGLEG